MKPHKWTILIATLGERSDKFRKLAFRLIEQAKKYDGQVQLLVYWNNYEFPLSEIRQDLVDNAGGEYISFVDDDDDVPEYYVDEVMKALKKNPDYVGWRMQVYSDGNIQKPTYHSLKYDRWYEDEKAWYRNISHLNPIKRELAKSVKFDSSQGVAEDGPWAERMAGIPKTEVYIEKIMYLYRHNTEDSVWRGKLDYKEVHYRPEIKSKLLTYYSKYGGLEPQQDKESYYVESYYERDIPENWFKERNLLRPDELAAIAYAFGQPFTEKGAYPQRIPKKVYSIGCGEGFMESQLEKLGVEVVGVDPAPGLKGKYLGKTLVKEYPGGGDTIIFCESIEHLYPEQFQEIWDKVPTCAWVIIVNWLDFHPIEPDNTGFDHVTRIDDDYFDKISFGQRVKFRRGSHLVMEKV